MHNQTKVDKSGLVIQTLQYGSDYSDFEEEAPCCEFKLRLTSQNSSNLIPLYFKERRHLATILFKRQKHPTQLYIIGTYIITRDISAHHT
jgi:hypothetical protein